MSISPLIERSDDYCTVRGGEGEQVSVSDYGPYPGHRCGLLMIVGRGYSASAVLTAGELRAVAQSCTKIAEQIETRSEP